MGLVTPSIGDLSSPTKDRTRVPCIGRQILTMGPPGNPLDTLMFETVPKEGSVISGLKWSRKSFFHLSRVRLILSLQGSCWHLKCWWFQGALGQLTRTCWGLGVGGSWRTACPRPRPRGEPWPHTGLQWRPRVAVGSPCLHLFNGNSTVAVVAFHRPHLSNSKCWNNGALLEVVRFCSATLGISSAVSLVISTAPS